MNIGVTGHRPDKLGGWDGPVAEQVQRQVREWLRAKLLYPTQGTRPHLYTGMALGTDIWAADEARALGIPFTAVIPFPAQPLLWASEAQQEHGRLLKLAHEVVYVSNIDPTTKYDAARTLHKRDDWMVQRVHRLLAVWDGSSGGTAHTVLLAQARGVVLDRLNPLELVRRATLPT